MKLIATEFGTFDHIDPLNENFRRHSKKLRITLEIVSVEEFYTDKFPQLLFTVLDLFPNLLKHKCSHGAGSLPSGAEQLIELPACPIKIVGDVIDTVHLFEHVVLELLCQIGEMTECSGLTCNYWEPSTRFDVFVEADDAAIAKFACRYGRRLFTQLLYSPEKSLLPMQDVLDLATRIYAGQAEPDAAPPADLNWPEERFDKARQRLRLLKYPLPEYLRAA